MQRFPYRHMTLRPCFDVVHRGNPNPDQYMPNRRTSVSPPIRKGRRPLRMCSFRGSYGNRGNGTELSSSDVVPVAGFEPARCIHQGILSPLRLPFRHTGLSFLSKVPPGFRDVKPEHIRSRRDIA